MAHVLSTAKLGLKLFEGIDLAARLARAGRFTRNKSQLAVRPLHDPRSVSTVITAFPLAVVVITA